MEFSTKNYKAPQAKVVEVYSQGMLCSSPEGKNTERFIPGDYSYGDDDFE